MEERVFDYLSYSAWFETEPGKGINDVGADVENVSTQVASQVKHRSRAQGKIVAL